MFKVLRPLPSRKVKDRSLVIKCLYLDSCYGKVVSRTLAFLLLLSILVDMVQYFGLALVLLYPLVVPK